jgi:hypothetical protein
MDFLFKIAYYAASCVSGLIIAGLFLANLLGSSPPSETWRHKVILTVAAACGFGLLYMGFRLGHQQSQWLAGLGMAVLALVVGGAVMFFGLMMFTKVNWQ